MMKTPFWVLLVCTLAGCTGITPKPSEGSISFNPSRAAWQERVTATLTNLTTANAIVTVSDVPVSIEILGANRFSFAVPNDTAGGPQRIVVRSGEREASASLEVFGSSATNESGAPSDELTLIVVENTSEATLRTRLSAFGFAYVEGSYSSLTDADNPSAQGPCGRKIARVRLNGQAPGASLERLLNDAKDILYHVDPSSLWDGGASQTPVTQVDHGEAINLSAARSRGLDGSGVTIAVVDTGVSAHTELSGRLETVPGFVSDGQGDVDVYTDIDGHGTPAAVLAAGANLGVASAARVIGVRACDVSGKCRASDITRAVCRVLARPDVNPAKLVLSFSFGGDTPISSLRDVLEYAVSKGTLVAAAAGNRGANGPLHYPAAYGVEGVVSVGALQFPNFARGSQTGRSSEGGSNGTDGRWSLVNLIDGNRGFVPDFFAVGTDNYGWSSNLRPSADSTEFVQFDFGTPQSLGRVDLYPRNDNGLTGEGFPVDFTIDVSDDGLAWTTVVSRTSYPTPTVFAAQRFEFPSVNARFLRFNATKLDLVAGGAFVQLSELEIFGSGWQPANFSSRNRSVEISAPGDGLRSGSSASNNASSIFSGTSFSTPVVAGALALWRQKNPDWTAAQIEAALRQSARVLPFAASEVGAGILDFQSRP
jgi:subtilisin